MNSLVFSLEQIQKFLETEPNVKVKPEDGLSSQGLPGI